MISDPDAAPLDDRLVDAMDHLDNLSSRDGVAIEMCFQPGCFH